MTPGSGTSVAQKPERTERVIVVIRFSTSATGRWGTLVAVTVLVMITVIIVVIFVGLDQSLFYVCQSVGTHNTDWNSNDRMFMEKITADFVIRIVLRLLLLLILQTVWR
jgi:hypothetical protein